MSEETHSAVDTTSRASRWAALPSWARIGIIAGLVIVVGILASFAWRLASRVPSIPLGETAAADLLPGSCLAEADLELEAYTVVPCAEPHAMQVFAVADSRLDEVIYTQAGEALRVFVDQICDKHLEYRLYLHEDVSRSEYDAFGIDVPTPEEYEAGEYDARCVIQSENGEDLTADLYRPLP